MKQIIQDLKTGSVTLVELPIPNVGSGKILIKVKKSLISLGTEKMMLEFGKGGWISKAKQQPDKVKMVLDKVKTDGLLPTIDTVMNKLSTPIPLGYSNVGEVIAVGKGVVKFKVGDRVISNGNHAEVVVPENLCALVPDSVSDEDAAFTVVSAIALQGVRLANPTLGETVVVLGLGLIGLITVQLLKANGCNVIGFDFDSKKVALANEYGAKAFETIDPVEVEKIIQSLIGEVGVDSVIITASTKSNDPIDLAPKICRHRGKVILVGVVGLEINRTEFFKKEITFQVSCSYGPGRYDNNYEQNGMDYPVGFVRWTENRNFCAVLDLLSNSQLNFSKLISRTDSFLNAPNIYAELSDLKNILGFILDYPNTIDTNIKNISLNPKRISSSKTCIGVIGAGGFTSGTLLPAIIKSSTRIKTISSSKGLSSHNLAEKFKIENNTSDYNTILSDEEIDTVIISTPHNSHGSLVLESLRSGKNVFVEKPLSLKLDEIEKIKEFYQNSDKASLPNLMVGFNRRFSPLSCELKLQLKKNAGTKAIIYTVNSGHIPSEHWIQDREVGGQRLIGEGCHFIDYIRFLVGHEIDTYTIVFADVSSRDTFIINLKFKDGSIGTINYFSNGNKSYPKEKVEIFSNGSIYLIDNFKTLTTINAKGGKSVKRLSKQDKGHSEEINQFIKSINSGHETPIPLKEIFEVSQIAIELDSMA